MELLEGDSVVGLLDVASHLVHRHRVEHLVAQLAHQCRQVRRHLHLAALLIVPVTDATVQRTLDIITNLINEEVDKNNSFITENEKINW